MLGEDILNGKETLSDIADSKGIPEEFSRMSESDCSESNSSMRANPEAGMLCKFCNFNRFELEVDFLRDHLWDPAPEKS